MVCAKTNGITKIVNGQTGHSGIKVYNAETRLCITIKENIVELCIVVSNSEGQLAFSLSVECYRAISLSLKYKLYFCCNILCSAAFIGSKCRLELFETVFCVVEVFNSFVKQSCRIISQQILEASESLGRLFKQLGCCLLIAVGIFDKWNKSPYLTVMVGIVIFSVLGADDLESFTLAVSTLFPDLSLQEGCDVYKVLHQFFRMRKCCLRHTLKNESDGIALFRLTNYAICFIDMTVSVTGRTQKFFGKIILRQYLTQIFVFKINTHIYSAPSNSFSN